MPPPPSAAGCGTGSSRSTASGRGPRSPTRVSSPGCGSARSLDTLREAAHSGRLAYGYLEDLFPVPARTRTLAEAADECGLEPELIRRIWTAVGFPSESLERIGEDDLQLLRYMASVLDAGFPLVAFLQLVRVYGQALAQIADAEVKLFHLYVHEPLMRDGVPGLEIAEAMEGIAAELLPLASPIMDRVHQRMLQHFVGQDVVGHLELEGAGEELGRLRVAIAFADLAGYTRLTEEAGEEQALDVVERFVDSVADTLPEEARVIKTIGDEVMVVGADPGTLVDSAVGFHVYARLLRIERTNSNGPPAATRTRTTTGRDTTATPRTASATSRSLPVATPTTRVTSPNCALIRVSAIPRVKGRSTRGSTGRRFVSWRITRVTPSSASRVPIWTDNEARPGCQMFIHSSTAGTAMSASVGMAHFNRTRSMTIASASAITW